VLVDARGPEDGETSGDSSTAGVLLGGTTVGVGLGEAPTDSDAVALSDAPTDGDTATVPDGCTVEVA
jgi:hypothetical protein